MLGAVEVLRDGAPVRLGGPKQRTVLALLALRLGRPISTDELIDALWGEDAPPGARHTLQTYISNLRIELGDIVVREAGGYRLELDRTQVDAARFEDEVNEARMLLAGQPTTAAARLRDALSLWRGHPFNDQTGVALLDAESRRLEELRLLAVEERIDADLAIGRHSQLVAELEGLTVENPLRERFRAQHMLALYRSGRQAEALRSFERVRQYLAEELGIDPSTELADLEQRILEHDSSLDLPTEHRIEHLALLVSQAAADPERALVIASIVREAVEAAGGTVIGDGSERMQASFADTARAVEAARNAQLSLAKEDAGSCPCMAIDRGDLERSGIELSGPPMTRGQSLAAAGHPGQVLLSPQAHASLADARSMVWQSKALGQFRLPGMADKVQVFQMVIEGLQAEFPPLVVSPASHAEVRTGATRIVRGYELREQAGSGDFGVVYRAYQPSVGREVAVKLLRPELIRQPAFVRLFEAEAQLIASLEHPHIVALYDFWREPEEACLVMRWMQSGSLGKSLTRGPWNPEPGLRLISQIGDALSYAHRRGVIHRDLKPSNVLLDEDGNGYLSDFGISERLSDFGVATVRPLTASPVYLPPEEARGEPLRVGSDIFSFGMLVFEILSGRSPPMDGPLPSLAALRPEIPSSVDSVVGMATRDDPNERFPTVDALVAALGEAIRGQAHPDRVSFTVARNPYKGLKAFDERDAQDFYGRVAVTSELVEAVQHHRMVTVVGPSGIGKSSLVRAGLIPALRTGVLPGSQDWLVTDLYPGAHPFEELETALLRIAVERPPSLSDELLGDPRGLARVTKLMLPPGGELLLLIDQFEELFTLTPDENERRRFMDLLVEAVTDARGGIRVVLTIRADFFDRPLRYPRFGELVGNAIVAVTLPDEEELRLAVERPAQSVGARFEPGLGAALVADLQEQPGALPLLQYALTELFAARSSDVLTFPGYREVGGVLGALGRRAEELYLGLDEETRDLTRQLFLRMASVTGDQEVARRRVLRSELAGLEVDQASVDEVIDLYGRHRLLTFDRDVASRGPTVELAHEAILREWPRLREWVADRKAELLTHRRLTEAVTEWEESSRTEELLLSRGRLDYLESWAAGTDLLLNREEREFLTMSRAEEDRRLRQAARRRRGIVAALTAGLLVIAVLAVSARTRAQVASARELAAASASSLASDPELAMLLALEGTEQTAVPQREAVEALHQALQANRVLATATWPDQRPAATQMAVALDEGGIRLATSADGSVVDIWDVATHGLLRTFGEPAGDVDLIAWPMIDWQGTRLIGLGGDGVLRVWDPESGALVDSVQANRLSSAESAVGPGIAEFSPDGSLIATAHMAGSPVDPNPVVLRVWNESLESLWEQPYDGIISVAFDPAGSFLAIARFAVDSQAGLIEVREAASGSLLYSFRTDAWASSITITPRGDLVVGRWDGIATIHNGSNGEQIGDMGPTGTPLGALAHSPAGPRIAMNGQIWDSDTNEMLIDLNVDAARVRFSSDGNRIAIGGPDLVGRVWAVGTPIPGEIFTLEPAPVVGAMDLSDNGSTLALLTLPRPYPSMGEVEVLAASDQHIAGVIPNRTGSGVALDPQGAVVAAFGQSGLGLWRSDGQALFAVLPESDLLVGREGGSGVAFSPNGEMVAAVGATGLAGLWRVADGTVLLDPWRVSSSQAVGVSFDGGGEFVVTTDNDGGVRIWDVADASELQSFDLDGYTAAVFFLADRRLIVLWQGGVSFLDLTNGERTDLDTRESSIGDLSPDGRLLAVARPEAIEIWDIAARRLMVSLRGQEGITGVQFDPNGVHLVTSGGNRVRTWTLDAAELQAIARSRATRHLTDLECQTYLHIEACPNP